MKTNKAGIDLIKRWEGLRLTAYKPVPWEQLWTIGYGHYGVAEGTVWTQLQADNQLVADLAKAEKAVSEFFTRPLNENQFSALVSFVHNLGIYVFVNDGWRRDMSDADITTSLMKYVYAGGNFLEGLHNRRKEEVALFNAKTTISVIEEEDMYLIDIVDNNRWYISNGVQARHIKTIRMLNNYKDQWGKLNLKVDRMYQSELEEEFGKDKLL